MKKKIFIWASGAILGTIFLSPLLLQLYNDLATHIGGISELTAEGLPTFRLLLIAWIVVGFLWWIILSIFYRVPSFFIPFLFMWSSILLFFTYLNYFAALILWLLFGFFICWIYPDSLTQSEAF
jgi:hypothetical protein